MDSVARPPLEIDRLRPVDRVMLDDTSWVDVVRGLVRNPEALFQQMLTDMSWVQGTTFRYEVDLAERRLHSEDPIESHPIAIRQTGLHLDARYRVRFGRPGLLRYRDGNDAMGLHRDRSMRWLDDTLVAILVLGNRRPFPFRPADSSPGDNSRDVDVSPGEGDLLVMGGRCQADWLHAVPRVDRATDRISVTWRWSSRRGQPDSSERYNADRRFGSSGRVGPQSRWSS